jgi:hypothetical protein
MLPIKPQNRPRNDASQPRLDGARFTHLFAAPNPAPAETDYPNVFSASPKLIVIPTPDVTIAAVTPGATSSMMYGCRELEA